MDTVDGLRMFEPFALRHLTVRNRIMQTAHSKGYSVNGLESARDLAYYLARARGGVGLMVIGGRFIHQSSGGPSHFASGYADGILEADRRITSALRAEGVVTIAQINHFGFNTMDGVDELHEAWGASDVPSPLYGTVPRPLEAGEDMETLIGAWADAAERCRDGGFDGVELLMGHGYLVHQFLSPLFNTREDEYGGSLENRARLAREVLGAVRERVGDDFVVGVRLSAADFVPGGLEPEDIVEVARLLAAHARVDFFDVTMGEPVGMPMPAFGGPADGWLAPYAGALKRAIPDVPVFVVGAIREPDLVEQILADGDADMVALTREQIADPDWVEKVRGGRPDTIYHCIRANQGCIARVHHGMPMGCTVNPLAGREDFFRPHLEPVAQGRRWLVVGGGPAGLKAAETLARRGHRVTLAEASGELGGQVRLILSAPGREDIGWLVRDLERQISDLGVEVRLDTRLDAAAVAVLAPDAVLVATGARPDRRGFSIADLTAPALEGHDQDSVVSGFDVLDGSATVGRRVVVLDDQGTRYAAAVCETLLAAGCEVVHVTPMGSVFAQTAWTLEQPLVYRRIFVDGYRSVVNSWAASVRGREVAVYNLYSRREEVVPECDTVVLVTQRHADDGLYRELAAGPIAVERIGDCVAPRGLDEAIFDGFVAGLEIDRATLPQPGSLERWPQEAAAHPPRS